MDRTMRMLFVLLICFSFAACGEAVSTKFGTAASETKEPEEEKTDALFAQMVQTVAPTAEKIKKTMNKELCLTSEQNKQLLSAASVLNVPVKVAGSLSSLGMKHYQPLKDFCNSVNSGKDAQTAYYEIDIEGVSEYRFTAKGGKIDYTSSYWNYSDSAPNSDICYHEKVDNIEFWNNGWLVWYANDSDAHISYGSGVRAVPLPEELIGLYEKYVSGLDWANDNVLTQNWDKQNHSVIKWEYLFGALLWHEGKELTMYEPVQTPSEDEGPYRIPAEDVEERLIRNFPVTVKELRTLPNYCENSQTYEFGYFPGSGSFITGNVEVTGKTQNPDGSFTLQLDWVDPDFAIELRGRYYLTIMPDDDGGYQYISNTVDDTIQDSLAK